MAELTLSYLRRGPVDRPAIVFLHGFLGCKEDWNEVIDTLGDQYRTILVDLPGHSDNLGATSDSFSFQNFSKELSSLLESLRVQSHALVGYSMGGRLALYHAVHNLENIASLVLVSTSPGLKTSAERLARLASDEQLAESLESEGLPHFVSRWYQQRLFGSLRKLPTFPEIAQRRTKGSAAALAMALSRFSIGRQQSLWDDLSKLTIPVLTVAGELDTKYDALLQRVADLCPHGKHRIISGAGHAVHLEKPRELAGILQEFMLAQS